MQQRQADRDKGYAQRLPEAVPEYNKPEEMRCHGRDSCEGEGHDSVSDILLGEEEAAGGLKKDTAHRQFQPHGQQRQEPWRPRTHHKPHVPRHCIRYICVNLKTIGEFVFLIGTLCQLYTICTESAFAMLLKVVTAPYNVTAMQNSTYVARLEF